MEDMLTMNEKMKRFEEESGKKDPECFGGYDSLDSLCKRICKKSATCEHHRAAAEDHAKIILDKIAACERRRKEFKRNFVRESVHVSHDAVLACR